MQNHLASTRNSVEMASESPDNGDDTEPATNCDDNNNSYMVSSGRKRSSQRLAGTGIKYVNSFFKLCLPAAW